MALEGSLKEFGIADILQLLYFQKKSGVLTITGKHDMLRLLFNNGNVVSIDSKSRAEEKRTGRLMVKKGIISPDALAAALRDQKGLRLGAYLLRNGLADRERIRQILTQQITETVVQLFSWKEGHYEFTAQGVPIDKDVGILLDTQGLLMEGLKVIDEWSILKGRVSLDTVLERQADAEAELTPEESHILYFVDGETDLSAVASLSGMDSLQAAQAILGLLEKGVVAKKEAPAAVIEKPAIGVGARSATGRLFGWFTYFLVLAGLMVAVLTAFALNLRPTGVQSASRELDALRFKVEVSKYKEGRYPSTVEGIDPWGNPYEYKAGESGFSLFSSGPDGMAGTPDDVL